ncbi:hypothetical protein HS048_21905 [Planomonospora sp. ID91781]|uniref:hypothetical protein n=1 Tax=Planomonospora sp. ID91781 TaxID=2738135 RepID=UPI0018C38010|nr:hypothetical protein [Planomonospora sp. ID91781]MBG0823388.1 hypothetical protein [Planomonospora sp. ID91781]
MFDVVKGPSPGHLASDTVLAGLKDDARRAVLDELDATFPLAHPVLSAGYCDAANRTAAFLPVTNDENLPALLVGGVLVFAYLDPETKALRVSVDLDSIWNELVRDDSTIPLQISISGAIVFDDSDQARTTGTTVPAPPPAARLCRHCGGDAEHVESRSADDDPDAPPIRACSACLGM